MEKKKTGRASDASLFMGRGNTAVDSFSHIEKPLPNTRQDALIRFKMRIYIAEPCKKS